MNNLKVLTNGIFKENPTFALLLGMCPTLGVTTSAINGMGMGLATAFVLVMSNLVISLVTNIIPDKIRIPSFIVIIAAFVTVVDMCMAAYLPSLHESLGLFIPLIVTVSYWDVQKLLLLKIKRFLPCSTAWAWDWALH